MAMARVSIIMGAYNCTATLPEALDSLLGQTFQDWELLLCDDGSTDGTLAVAEEYARRDARVRVLRNGENLGLNRTLNRCLAGARGEYVARMDGDDVSLPERLEKEVAFLDAHPEFALVSTAMAMFDEGGVWGEKQVIPEPQIDDFCLHTPFFVHAAAMIRREAFCSVGGYSESKWLLRVEDCHLWFKLYARGFRGANLPEVLYLARDDRFARRRRSMRARVNGVYVMAVGFRMVRMPWPKYIYVLRCAALEMGKALVPSFLYDLAHKRRYGKEAPR